MVRRSRCGKMEAIWAMEAGEGVGVPREEEEEPGVEGGLARNQRRARKPTRATATSCGMLIEVCMADAMAVNVGMCVMRGWVWEKMGGEI